MNRDVAKIIGCSARAYPALGACVNEDVAKIIGNQSVELTEARLSRVWHHYEDPNIVFAMISASRGEYEPTPEVNVQRTRSLAADISNLHYGYFFIDGFWTENKGTPQEKKVQEITIFVICDAKREQQFIKDIMQLAKAYDQESVVFKTTNGNKSISANGSEFDIGKLYPGRMGEIYSRLRNKKDMRARVFTFESERSSPSWPERVGMRACQKTILRYIIDRYNPTDS